MRISESDLTDLGLCLNSSAVLSLRPEHALLLRCLRGELWVTVGGDSADYWLKPGESLHVPASGDAVIEARKDSRVHFETAATACGAARAAA